jgi:hypothetical protein
VNRGGRGARAALGGGLALLLGASCVSGFDRNDQIVTNLRILGVRGEVEGSNDLADADVGDTVDLSALLAYPPATGTVTVTWLTCIPLPNRTTTPCTDEGLLRDPPSLIGMPGVLTLGTGPSIQVVVPDEVQPLLDATLALADQQASAECSLFIELPLIVIAQASDHEVFTTSKSLRLSPYHQIEGSSDPNYQYQPNLNPSIDALFLDPPARDTCAGQPVAQTCLTAADCGGAACTDGVCPFPDGPQSVCAHIPDTGELVTRCGLDGPIDMKPEQPTVTWYATAGSIGGFSSPRGTGGGSDLASRTYTNFARPPDGPFTLYAVVRDGRNGEAWFTQDFQ